MFSSPKDPLKEYLHNLQPQQQNQGTRWQLVIQPRNLFSFAKALFFELLLLRLVLLRIAVPLFLMIFILVNTLGSEWESVPQAISFLGLVSLLLTFVARIRAALNMGPDVSLQLARNLRVLSWWFWAGVLAVGLMVSQLLSSQEQLIGWSWAIISLLVLCWHCFTMLRPRLT